MQVRNDSWPPMRQERQRQQRRRRRQRRRLLSSSHALLLNVSVLLGFFDVSTLHPTSIHHCAAEAIKASATTSSSSSSNRQTAFTTSTSTSYNSPVQRPNFLFIVCDQLRYDALGYVQARMASYNNKVKVKTPNLDRLAALGISFEVAYTTSPSCGPARASLKTGCTVTRTGLVSNQMAKDSNLTRQVPIFRDRLQRLVSYEQVLTQYWNYNVESYGKWHTDPSLYYTKTVPIRKAVQYTAVDWRTNTPRFEPVQTIKPVYLASLKYLLARDQVNATPRPGQLLNKMSMAGYDPLPIDTSYDAAAAAAAASSATSAAGSSAMTTSSTVDSRRFPDTDRVSFTRYEQERPRKRSPPSSSGGGGSSSGSGSEGGGGFASTDDSVGDGGGGDDGESDGGDSTTAGRDVLGPAYTTTAIVGQMSLMSLERNVRNYQVTKQPFLLSVHFNAPHPPVIGTGVYFDYYYANRNNLAIPTSLQDPMINSAYKYSNQRKFLRTVVPSTTTSFDTAQALTNATSDPNNYYPFMDPNRIAELTAAYYSTVEEVDAWIGRLVNRLEQLNMMGNTRIIFTSDHGDLLGAHGMLGKSVLLEEASRVPLILYAPGTTNSNGWEGGRILKRPVSHLSLYATILDYAGAGSASLYDTSDGTSLRSFVERRSYNANYDDDVVVVELNGRRPLNATRLFGMLGGNPSFMIRKGNYKLLVPRTSGSRVLDMMYNLTQDPWEMTNLLGSYGMSASDAVIGKAEHLKALLLEWMIRNDGPYRYYSDPMYNMNEGLGDVQELRNRQTWRQVPLWISDVSLKFGAPVRVTSSTAPAPVPAPSKPTPPNLFVTTPSSSSSSWDAIKFLRNEYLYVGRTTAGGETLLRIDVQGPDAFRFTAFPNRARLGQGDYVKIKVSYVSGSNFGLNASDMSASVRIRASVVNDNGTTTASTSIDRTIPLVCVLDNQEEETMTVRPTLRSNRIVNPADGNTQSKSKRRRRGSRPWMAASLVITAIVVGAALAAVVLLRRRRRHSLIMNVLRSWLQKICPCGIVGWSGGAGTTWPWNEADADAAAVPCDDDDDDKKSTGGGSSTSEDDERSVAYMG